MSQAQVTTEEMRPRGVYSIDQILGVATSTPARKNSEGKLKTNRKGIF